MILPRGDSVITIVTRDNYSIITGQIACLSDNNEVWSDRLSDQIIRREPKGLSCICLVDCESDRECQINFVYGLT